MELFKPELTLIREPDGTYTLHASTAIPSTCFRAGRSVAGVPDGWAAVPEAMPYQLEVLYRGPCLPVVTTVSHRVQALALGSGKDAVVAYITLDGKVLGVNSVRRSAAHGVVSLARRAVAPLGTTEVSVRCLSLGSAGEIVIACCPQPVTSLSQQLKEVGVPDGNAALIFVENIRQRVAAAGCQINTAEIPSGPDDTVEEVRDAVFQAAR